MISHMYTHIHAQTCVHEGADAKVCMYACAQPCMYACLYVCTHAMYACMYVNAACLCMYVHFNTSEKPYTLPKP